MERIRVLVADDSRAILDAYAAVLGDADAYDAMLEPDVVEVLDGGEAVAAVRHALTSGEPFSVVILDYRMPPGITGLEAAVRIRALDPQVRIVLISGVADVEPEAMIASVPPAGLVSYMRKPVRPPDLLRHIGRLLGFGGAEQPGGAGAV
jgi:CheY-like chemotaxis protein